MMHQPYGSGNAMTMTQPFGQRTTIRRPQVNEEDGGYIFQPPEVQPTPQSSMGVQPPAGTQGQTSGTPTPVPTAPAPSMAPQSAAPTPSPTIPAPASPVPAAPAQPIAGNGPSGTNPNPTPGSQEWLAQGGGGRPPVTMPTPQGSVSRPPSAMDEYNRLRAAGQSIPMGLNIAAAQENMMRESAKSQGVSDADYPEWLRVQKGGLTAADQERARQGRMQEERDRPGGLGDQRDAAQQARMAEAFKPRFGPSSESGEITDPAYVAAVQREKSAQGAYDQNLATARAPQAMPPLPQGEEDELQRFIREGGRPQGPQADFGVAGEGMVSPAGSAPQRDLLQQLLKGGEGVTAGAGGVGGQGPMPPGFDRAPPPQSDYLRRLLASEAGPTMTPQSGGPTPPRQLPPEGAPPQRTAETPLTGNEGPTSIEPPSGETDPLQSLLQSEAQRQLKNPSVYDDQLFQGQLQQAKAGLSDEYDASKQELDADLANRGIDFSTIAGTRQAQLLNDRNRKLNDVVLPLMRDRAMSLGSARSAAFDNARGVSGDIADRGFRGRQEARGERGYRDTQRRTARDESIQEYQLGEEGRRYEDSRMQELLRNAMQYGQGGGGMDALLKAAGIYGGAGREYGGQAADIEGGLADLWDMIMSGAYNN